MSQKEHKNPSEVEQTVGEAIGKSEQFIENNKKSIITIVVVIALIVLAIIAYNNLYQKPREIDAENAMYKAEEYFAVDSFRLALQGKGEVLGFEEIASKYGSTKSGNLAQAYVGICEFKLGNYDKAIDELSKYDAKNNAFKTSVIGLIGDCYAELKNSDKAQSFYKKAIDIKDELAPIYLKKSGVLYELSGDKSNASKQYQEIKDNYPQSMEAGDIDKYIERVK